MLFENREDISNSKRDTIDFWETPKEEILLRRVTMDI